MKTSWLGWAIGSVFFFSLSAFAQLEVEPSFVDFGDVLVGTSGIENVSITNFSNQTLNSLQFSLEGDMTDYQIQSGGCFQLPANGSCTVAVIFYPQIVGYFVGTLVIQSEAESTSVNLSGSGYKSYPVLVSF